MASNKPLVKYLSLEGDTIDRVNNILFKAVQELNADIARLQGSTRIGDQITLLQAKSTKTALMRQTDTVFKNIEDVMAQGKRSSAILASRIVSEEENPLLKLLLPHQAVQDLAASEASRASATVEAVMARFSSSYKPLSQRVYDSAKLTRGYVDQMVGVQLAKGASWGDFAKAARDMIDPNTPGGVAYAAKRLARTEINNAFHASSVERYKNSSVPGIMVDWNLSGSHKVPDDCNKYDEEGPYAPEAVPEKPHPQCLCFITAQLPSEDDFINSLFGGAPPEDKAEQSAEMQSATELFLRHKEGSEMEKSAMESYMGSGNRAVNDFLRHNSDTKYGEERYGVKLPGIQTRIRHLDSLLAKQDPLQKSVTVFRGTPSGVYSQGDVGKLITDKAFGSSTLLSKKAESFARGDGVFTEIVLPKGYKAGAANLLDESVRAKSAARILADEAEVILPRNTKFKLVSLKEGTLPSGKTGMIAKLEAQIEVKATRAPVKKAATVATKPKVTTIDPLTPAQRRAQTAKAAPIKTSAKAAKSGSPKIDAMPRFTPEASGFYSNEVRHPVNPWNPSRGKNTLPSDDRRWNVNCTRTSAAYELRRRGYDVTAGPRMPTQNDNYIVNIASKWVDKTGTPRPFQQVYSAKNLPAELEKRPEGARFFVQGAWKNGGAHIWNAEIKQGKLIMYESQSLNGDPSVYLSKLKGPVRYLRVDDLSPTDKLVDDLWIYANGATKPSTGSKKDDLSWL